MIIKRILTAGCPEKGSDTSNRRIERYLNKLNDSNCTYDNSCLKLRKCIPKMTRISCSPKNNLPEKSICFSLLSSHRSYVGDWKISGFDKQLGRVKCFLTFEKNNSGKDQHNIVKHES